MDWVREAKEKLQNNQVILSPTDTVWGLSGNALQEDVAKKIYALKQRPTNKSFLLLLPSFNELSKYVNDNLSVIKMLVEDFDRPTTVIYKQPKGIPEFLLAPDGSIGIRIPKKQWLQEFLAELDFPLISTSANISGQKTPIHFGDLSKEIINGVDYIVPHIPKGDDASSQICKFEGDEIVWIRR